MYCAANISRVVFLTASVKGYKAKLDKEVLTISAAHIEVTTWVLRRSAEPLEMEAEKRHGLIHLPREGKQSKDFREIIAILIMNK